MCTKIENPMCQNLEIHRKIWEIPIMWFWGENRNMDHFGSFRATRLLVWRFAIIKTLVLGESAFALYERCCERRKLRFGARSTRKRLGRNFYRPLNVCTTRSGGAWGREAGFWICRGSLGMVFRQFWKNRFFFFDNFHFFWTSHIQARSGGDFT